MCSFGTEKRDAHEGYVIAFRIVVDAPEIVRRWSEGWSRGACPAVGSILDVMAGDVIEEERGTRPEGTLVEVPARGEPRIDAEAFSSWTFGWPKPPGPVAKAAWATGLWPVKWIDRRLNELSIDADRRQRLLAGAMADLGAIDWEAIADMEVLSLAMGHLGPSRQEAVLGIVEAALFSRAAAAAASWYYGRVDGMARDRLHKISELAESTARLYEDPFAQLAETSAHAIRELGRRAGARGLHVADPFSLPVRAWLPLLSASAPA